LPTNANDRNVRADLAIEAVFVHAQVSRGISKADEPWGDCRSRRQRSHAISPSRRHMVGLTLSQYAQCLRVEGGRAGGYCIESLHNDNRQRHPFDIAKPDPADREQICQGRKPQKRAVKSV
jgi:hypothetical protein